MNAGAAFFTRSLRERFPQAGAARNMLPPKLCSDEVFALQQRTMAGEWASVARSRATAQSDNLPATP